MFSQLLATKAANNKKQFNSSSRLSLKIIANKSRSSSDSNKTNKTADESICYKSSQITNNTTPPLSIKTTIRRTTTHTQCHSIPSSFRAQTSPAQAALVMRPTASMPSVATTALLVVIVLLTQWWCGHHGVHSTGNNAVDLVQLLAGYESLGPWHDIEPDAYLNPTEFIRSRGFDVELHRIVTADGYILSMNRIVNPMIAPHDRDLLRPALLQHGLLTSSMVFMSASDRHRDRPRAPSGTRWRRLRKRRHNHGNHGDRRGRRRLLPPLVRQDRGSWRFWADVALNTMTTRHGYRQLDDRTYVTDSLAFLLANQHYDVWMPNSRGTRYSLNHTHYDHAHDQRYWEFSFHEHALYDLPACIEHVLAHTGHSSLAYVGHSQGNMMMFILQSLRPEYADKIRPFVAVAPIAFIPDLYFGLLRPLTRTLAPDTAQLNALLKGQVFNQGPVGQLMLDLLCRPRYMAPVCDMALLLTLGDALKRANRTQTAMLVHHIPDSTSVHNLLHFAQLVNSARFEAFDYGPAENLQRYGTKFPTRYPIENIVSRDIALVWGARDPLATPKNVALTRSRLSVPLMDDYLAPDLAWGHSDFFYARGAGKLINLHILSLLERYN